MRRARLDQLLTGAAVAAALAFLGTPNLAFAQSSTEIEAAVPMPDTAELPPPTAADLGPAPGAVTSKDTPKETAAPPAPETTGTVQYATASAVAADTAIADKLRELGAGKFDRVIGGKRERATLEAFYGGRNHAPLWIANGAMNERAKATVAYLAGVDADGLDPADYSTPDIKAGLEPDALAEAELRFTQAVLSFARHAQNGRVHFTRIAADIDYDQVKSDPADVLAKLASATDVKAALDGFNPQQPGYKALKAKLAEARGSKSDAGAIRIPSGPVLKLAKDKKGKEIVMDDPRVPQLRERLGVAGDASSTAYDKPLADAVAAFQKQRELQANGQLNAATLLALNGPSRDHTVDTIVANLERWRWMPRELGNIYVMVNIPDYSLRLVRDGKLYWNTKIVVGKPHLATPIMSAEMKFITVNPTWNVPPSIIKNEYLPALQNDPQALERIGLKVEQNPDGTVRIYQPPGDRNALGRIRFNFPNKFLVYQHDTPDKHLFAHDKRAYSHGCMRVENPLMYGEKILSLALPNEGYTQERLKKMFGGLEININFPKSIPVHLTYQTAFVDDNGKLVIREDIYGRDTRVLANLKGSERRMADVPMDRPKNTSAVPVRMPNGSFAGSSGSGWRGPSFFDQLFGITPAAPPPPQTRAQQRQRAASR